MISTTVLYEETLFDVVFLFQIRHLETCINEGDTKLHSELSKLVKENEKLKEDKESTEGTVVTAQDQLAAAQRENSALRDQLAAVQEELRTVRQKSKEEVADLEYKVEQLLAKKQSLIVEITTLSASVAELESACKMSFPNDSVLLAQWCPFLKVGDIWRTRERCGRPLLINRYVWRMLLPVETSWKDCLPKSGQSGKPSKRNGNNSKRLLVPFRTCPVEQVFTYLTSNCRIC